MAKSRSEEPVQETEQISESYISIGLGLLVVVVVGILLYNYFTQRNQPTTQTGQESTPEATAAARPGQTYTVVAGDTLWSISEKAYGTGYNWQDIAKANNLTNSDQLEAGTVLQIPEVTPVPAVAASTAPEATPVAPVATSNPTPVATPVPTPVATPVGGPMTAASPAPAASPQATITGETYTIVAGDTLWDIACRAYGDCYAWPKLAQANNVANPDLIFTGNELRLPR